MYQTKPNLNEYLFKAIKNQDVALVQHYLKQGADLTAINDKKQTPMHFAAKNGFWNCVEVIATNRNDTKHMASFGAAIYYAVLNGKYKHAELVLKAGASLTWYQPYTENGLLHLAVANNDVKMLALLLAYGADVNKQNKAKQTPEQLAASLNSNCYDRGWQICENNRIFLPIISLMLVQAQRQQTSFFSAWPVDLFELLLCYAGEGYVLKHTFKYTQTKLTQIPVKCFIEDYSSGIHWRSELSKQLVLDVKCIIENNSENDQENKINRVICNFFTNKTQRKESLECRATELLNKYKLINDSNKIKFFPSHTNNTSTNIESNWFIINANETNSDLESFKKGK